MDGARAGSSTSRLDRALLSLEGLALGDAFGETFFGPDPDERVARRELRDGPWPWTDDTAMALSIVETLSTCGSIVQDDLAERFASRYRSEPARGYGPGTHRLLAAVLTGESWQRASAAGFGGLGSWGNGAAMRAPVLGAWFADDDLEAVVEQASLSAAVTHSHPDGVAGAVAIAVAAALACRGGARPSRQEFIELVLARTPDGAVADGVRQAAALPADTSIEEAARVLGNGERVSAADTVPLVLWCCARYPDDYEQALWLTVSALGDRDTTCAMVGGIIACRVGHRGLPDEWLAHREALPALQLVTSPASLPAGLLTEARQHPGGHVYVLDPGYGPRDAVPPQAIKGAWAVAQDGVPTGRFLPNPNYRGSSSIG